MQALLQTAGSINLPQIQDSGGAAGGTATANTNSSTSYSNQSALLAREALRIAADVLAAIGAC